jgi:hypothetical protein
MSSLHPRQSAPPAERIADAITAALASAASGDEIAHADATLPGLERAIDDRADDAGDLNLAGVPTCARQVFFAAITVALVAAGGVAAVSAFRPPVDRGRSVVAASTPRPPQEARVGIVPSPPPQSDLVDLELDSEPSIGSEPVARAPFETDTTKGTLVLPPAAEGHRVYIDGRLIGALPAELVVPCGRHVVKIGSRGRDQRVVVPCGEDVFVAYP